MKLVRARIQNFRSIEDTGEFCIDDLTCLVGKNESGKSAILHALCALNPADNSAFDRTRDYPRRYLSKFDDRHPDGESEVIRTWWDLSSDDLEAVEEELGVSTLTSTQIEVSGGFGFGQHWKLEVDQKQVIENEIENHDLNDGDKSTLSGASCCLDAVNLINEMEEPSAQLISIREKFLGFPDGEVRRHVIEILSERMPKFFLTSHYDQMSGKVAIRQLQVQKNDNKLSKRDQIFLDFIEYAGTSVEELQDAQKYEELVAKCEGASNDITDEIFKFWSQNAALEVKIDLSEGRPADEPPFNNGTIATIRISNNIHRASVPLDERSSGFIWFFSFLSQFKQLSKKKGDVVLLLDEPGLTLHGKAQSDLVTYIEKRLLAEHQVIYTTHSPFMIPPNRLLNVRVVEDVVIEPDGPGRPEIKGTKVSEEILSVDGDTLFPLRGHLGYEITQTLFIGENTLLVEGPSDILFLQSASHALKARGREGLNPAWTICPTGGIDKIQTFASLFAGNNLNIVVLSDYAKGDKAKIERLRQSQILSVSNVFTVADFTSQEEADIEDLFTLPFYAKLVSKAFGLKKGDALSATKLNEFDTTTRAVKKTEAAFRLLPDYPEFDHFTPAAFLLRNLDLLSADSKEVEETLDRFEKVFRTINPLARLK